MQALIHIWAFPRMIILFLWWHRLRFLLNETKFLSALVMGRLLDRCNVGRRDTWEVLLGPGVVLRVGVQTRDLGNETVSFWGTLWGFHRDWGCVFSYCSFGWSWRCALSNWCLLASLYSLHIDEFEIFRWGYWSLLPFSVRGNIVLDETIDSSDWTLIFL